MRSFHGMEARFGVMSSQVLSVGPGSNFFNEVMGPL